MKRSYLNKIFIFLFLLCTPELGHGFPGNVTEWELNNIELTPNDVMTTTGRDPFIVFKPVNKPLCEAGIAHFVIEFLDRTMPSRPFSMELFWHSKYDSNRFTEKNKAFLILIPPTSGDIINFYVRLDRLIPYVYSTESDLNELRLDFPSNFKLKFKILNAQILPNDHVPSYSTEVKTLYRLHPGHFLRLDIGIPLICKIFKDGFHRLWLDPVFTMIWLLIILSLLIAIRFASKNPAFLKKN